MISIAIASGANFAKTYLLDQHVKILWDFWCEACDHSVSL